MRSLAVLVWGACLVVALSGRAQGQGAPPPPPPPPEQPEEPKDPRCKEVLNEDTDQRDFVVMCKGFGISGGMFEHDIDCDDDGNFVGKIKINCDLSPEIPVIYDLHFLIDSNDNTVAGNVHSFKGMLDQFPTVVQNMNCFLNPPLELPYAMGDFLEVNVMKVYSRIFPAGFPHGDYYTTVNMTSPVEGQCNGIIEIRFMLLPPQDD